MSPEQLVGLVFGVSPATLSDTTSNQILPEWDSLGHLTLITEVQAVYGIDLSPEDALSMTSIAAIKSILAARGVEW